MENGVVTSTTTSAWSETTKRERLEAHGRSLRAPGERWALAFCIVTNFIVLTAAGAIVFLGTEWLETHPFVAAHINVIRTVLIGALIAVPAAVIGRRVGLSAARSSGVRVNESQFPELYTRLLEACEVLGLERVPEVYVSNACVWPATAHTTADGQSTVVMHAHLFDDRWRTSLDALTFVMAGALGSIRLGHTGWLIEALTVYTQFLPWVRTPLYVKWIQSRDRCAAYVVPNGIQGLLFEAVGKDVAREVNVDAFIEETARAGGFWEKVEAADEKRPPIVARARDLYDAGFFTRTHGTRATRGSFVETPSKRA